MRLKADEVRSAGRSLDEGDPLPPDDRVARVIGWIVAIDRSETTSYALQCGISRRNMPPISFSSCSLALLSGEGQSVRSGAPEAYPR